MTTHDQTEARRLEALYELDLLDSGEDEEYTELVELAAEICNTPISFLALIDSKRQWFKARVGLDSTETTRDYSFCKYTIQQPGMTVVDDLRQDRRFREHAAVMAEPGLRFYAGVPLMAGDNHAVGTLCVMDAQPRTLTASQIRALGILARQVETQMKVRARRKQLVRITKEKDRLSGALENKNRMFSAFMDHGPFVSYIKDGEGRLVFYNSRLRESFGVEGDAWLGKSDGDLWSPELAARLREDDLRVMQGGSPVITERETPGPGNSTLTWRNYKFPIVDEENVLMLAGISVEVTEEIARNARLENALVEAQTLTRSLAQSHAVLRTLLEHTPNQWFIKDEDGRYLFYNRKFADHFEIGEQNWLGKTDFELLPTAVAEQLRAEDLLAMNSDGMLETVGEPTETGVRYKMLRFRCMDPEGRRMLAGMAIDISDEVERHEELRRACVALEEEASLDALTGLPNRRVFDARLQQEFARAREEGKALSLMIMDVDDFKARNDRFGHVAGDRALRLMGKALETCCGEGCLAARIGGEEFALLMPNVVQVKASEEGERVLACVRAITGTELPLSVSIGLATMSEQTHSAERLYRHADDAMYTAKRQGKDRLVVHSVQGEPMMRAVLPARADQKSDEEQDRDQHPPRMQASA